MTNLPDFGVNEGVWKYSEEYFIVRYRTEKKVIDESTAEEVIKVGKEFKPYILVDGQWKKKHPVLRPIYQEKILNHRADATVLIVEGEKTADAAAKIFPDYVCITWSGGASSLKSTDWRPMAGRKAILWPDADNSGTKCMNKLAGILRDQGSFDISIVDISLADKPKGWDLADCEDLLEAYELLKELSSAYIHIEKDEKENRKIINFPHLTQKGNPLNTSANVKAILDHYGHKVRFNIVSNQVECFIKGANYSKVNEKDCFFAEISELCVLNNVPKVDLDMWLLKIADECSYSPARDFINSKPWDGNSRLKQFLDTVTADNQELADKLIYRWMLGATAAAFSDNGVSLPGVLVFQGPQGTGKTAWFERLLPDSNRDLLKVSLTIKPKDTDSVVDCTNIWLGELGELDETFSASRISSLKAFTSKDSDSYRVAWGKREKRIPRHTAYFASVNPSNFLVDETGNRRWWTISIKSLVYKREERTNLDIQQVWAEFKHLLDSGESYNLTHEEISAMNLENNSFITMDPMEETIRNLFRWDEKERYTRLTSTEVLIKMGYDLTNYKVGSIAKKCGGILYKLTGEKSQPSHGKMVFNLPRLR